VGTVLVFVGAEGIELRLKDRERCGRRLLVEEAPLRLVEALDLAAGLRGWDAVDCLATIPRRSSSDPRSTLPLRDLPVKTAPLSVRKASARLGAVVSSQPLRPGVRTPNRRVVYLRLERRLVIPGRLIDIG
jgi:hypothetical protein